MAATFKALNFQHNFTLTASESFQVAYTVPALKVAKVALDQIINDILLATTGTNGEFAIHLQVKIGSLTFAQSWKSGVLADQLNGGVFKLADLATPVNFWETSGEFILPLSAASLLSAAAGTEPFTRWFRGVDASGSTTLKATDKMPRTFYLSAAETVEISAHKEIIASTTFTEEIVHFALAGSIVEDDA